MEGPQNYSGEKADDQVTNLPASSHQALKDSLSIDDAVHITDNAFLVKTEADRKADSGSDEDPKSKTETQYVAPGGNPNLERVTPYGGHEDKHTFEDEISSANFQTGIGTRQKKKGKAKSKRAAKAGTGFEEYYVDAPLTPAEHEVEKDLYHLSLPFAQRIETAVQRYAAKRNMDSIKRNIFDKYLVHGGIEGGPKMFSGGLDAQTLGTRDARDIATLTATNFVPFNKADPKNDIFVVDFEGCLKAFLSYNVPTTFDLVSEDYIKCLINVLRNFLNYLLYHDVCPEYKTQIEACKRLCDQAQRELWATAQCTVDLPGDFNKACSEIFGGLFQGQWTASQAWLTDEDKAFTQGMSPDLARRVFKMGIVANAGHETFDKFETQSKAKTIGTTNVKHVSLEITEVTPSNTEVQSLYASRGSLRPIGTMKAKTWHSPFAPAEDLTEEEESALTASAPPTKHYEFWVEDEVQKNCFPGMKLDTTVTELSIGISYFDAIHGIYCSFFDISANERMSGWRKPESEWLPMRATGGGPLEKEGDDDETAVGDGDRGTAQNDEGSQGAPGAGALAEDKGEEPDGPGLASRLERVGISE